MGIDRRLTYDEWVLQESGMLDDAHVKYSMLYFQLLETPFEVKHPMDQNRVKGGLNIRTQYVHATGIFEDMIRNGPCTVLEMMLGLAGHMVLFREKTESYWIWEMIDNLGLSLYSNDNYDPLAVHCILYRWMSREFEPDGKGSPFPIDIPTHDMRKEEVWVQMNAYLTEKYPLPKWI